MIDNTGETPWGSLAISSENRAAVLFQMTAGPNRTLEGVTALLRGGSNEGSAETYVEIWTHASNDDPEAGALLATLNPNPLTGTSYGGTYTLVPFTPPSPVALHAGGAYWVVFRGATAGVHSIANTGVDPTGPAGVYQKSMFIWPDVMSDDQWHDLYELNTGRFQLMITAQEVEYVPLLAPWALGALGMGLLGLAAGRMRRRAAVQAHE